MIRSEVFWLVLGLAAVAYWLLPLRLRMGFLAEVSIGFLPVGVHSIGASWSGALIGSGSVLAWSLLFYGLAPRAIRRVADSGSAEEAPATARAMEGGVATAEAVAVLSRPRTRAGLLTGRGVLLLLIPSILIYLICFKCILPSVVDLRRSPVGLFVPLGLSYFTFKLIHYAVEVARGGIRDRSLPRFLAYMFLFPAFTAGPIERYDHFLANCEQTLRLQSVVEGLTRIVHGLVKRCVIAQMLLWPSFDFASQGRLVENVRTSPTWSVWLTAIAVYLYLYMDFSSYSDIAVGGSRLFGVRIMENFNSPLLASTVVDFWKRWHMTLASWCQSYVYMPVLGWTRSPYIAVYAAFVAIGLWHEASVPWLIWGIYHATGVAVCQWVARAMRARQWGSFDRPPWIYAGVPMTFVFVVVGTVVAFGGMHQMRDVVHVLAKLVCINLA